jgi:hypothetical protein
MLNPARDFEYPFALGIMDMSTIDVVPKKDIPAEHALDKNDLADPPEGIKPVDPRDRPKDTLDEPDDIGVDVI